MRLQNIQAVAKTRLIMIRSQPNSFVAVVVVDIVRAHPILGSVGGLNSKKRVTQ